jgi:flagellar biosynthesis/type III secretory pathway M-ring protein FliF/YscJ
MKNNEWNVPSDYFEKNKKALIPVRKFPTGKWILVLAAACFIGIGLFIWMVEGQVQEVAQVEEKNEKQNERENEEKIGEEEVREGKIIEDMKGEEKVREGKIIEDMKGEEKVREGKRREDVAEELKEIPREELVEYLLEEDSDFIENIN